MDTTPSPKGPANSNPMLGRPLGMPVIIMLILAALAFVTIALREQASLPAPISYDEFVRQVTADNVSSVEISGNSLHGGCLDAPPNIPP